MCSPLSSWSYITTQVSPLLPPPLPWIHHLALNVYMKNLESPPPPLSPPSEEFPHSLSSPLIRLPSSPPSNHNSLLSFHLYEYFPDFDLFSVDYTSYVHNKKVHKRKSTKNSPNICMAAMTNVIVQLLSSCDMYRYCKGTTGIYWSVETANTVHK